MERLAPRTLPAGARGGAPGPAVSLRGVRKRYGAVTAVDGLDLTVAAGNITALVGPNGAGKTTAVECIEGLRRPDAGTVRVLGLDPVRDHQRLFQRVGVLLQEGDLPERLRVGELVTLFASLYRRPAATAPLLERLGLAGKERTYYSSLSGGQKRRLGIALALAGSPELVILDEPTSGLDPQGRHQVWALLHEIAGAGATVLATTHYLEEAEDHCEEVVIVDHGRAVGAGEPHTLLDRHGLGVRVRLPLAGDGAALATAPGVTHSERVGGDLILYGRDPGVFDEVKRVCATASLPADGLELRPARLEDLFLLLTGREYREE